eukprot:scaffold247086_cov35-Tisochrysis_lutea.AAC.1
MLARSSSSAASSAHLNHLPWSTGIGGIAPRPGWISSSSANSVATDGKQSTLTVRSAFKGGQPNRERGTAKKPSVARVLRTHTNGHREKKNGQLHDAQIVSTRSSLSSHSVTKHDLGHGKMR